MPALPKKHGTWDVNTTITTVYDIFTNLEF